MLQYDFMRRALIIAFVISVSIPLIGTVIVLKRMSNIGEALSHTSLAGVALGVVLGINPTIVAAVLAIISSVIIEVVRKKIPQYAEISVNIVLSAGIGLAAILSGFGKNSANLNSYLFGSIVAVNNIDIITTIIIAIIIIAFSILLYRQIFNSVFDEEHSKIFGVNNDLINIILSFITAIAVSVTSRIVGALIVSSFIFLPTACAMLIAKSYKKCIIWSVIFALFFAIVGLIISFYFDLKPAGTMILLGVIILLVMLLFRKK